jgi:hypothetical protein
MNIQLVRRLLKAGLILALCLIGARLSAEAQSSCPAGNVLVNTDLVYTGFFNASPTGPECDGAPVPFHNSSISFGGGFHTGGGYSYRTLKHLSVGGVLLTTPVLLPSHSPGLCRMSV